MRKAAVITFAIVLATVVVWAGNNLSPRRNGNAPFSENTASTLFNQHLIDSAISLIRSGDIVLRTGLGADSHMLACMNRKDKTYSHCGIVMVENGYPFVYHCIGGEDNPDERLRRDSAALFFSPLHNKGFAIVSYNYDRLAVTRLMEVVHTYYKQRPRFDLKFDLSTDDRLYCSEFVYKAVNKALNDPGFIKTTAFLGRTFVAIDNLFINDHAHFVWQAQFK
jgi:hypothetical protein